MKTKGKRLKVDEIVKSQLNGWMPAFAGMTVFIAV